MTQCPYILPDLQVVAKLAEFVLLGPYYLIFLLKTYKNIDIFFYHSWFNNNKMAKKKISYYFY